MIKFAACCNSIRTFDNGERPGETLGVFGYLKKNEKISQKVCNSKKRLYICSCQTTNV